MNRFTRAISPVLRLCKHHGVMVTPPPLPADIHGAGHPGWGGPPHADVPEADAGVFVAAPAMMRVAAACRAPRTYAGDLCYSASPTRAADVAGGVRSAGSESLGTPAAACPATVRRRHWLGDFALAFSAPAAPDGKSLVNACEKIASRSWIKKRYAWSEGIASRNCCSVQSAVGCAVTFTCSTRRGACSYHHEHQEEAKRGRHHDTEITGDDRLGMVADKGPPALRRATVRPPAIQMPGRYFRTVRGDTRRPSLSSNSLAIRSWPQVGFSWLI